MAAKEIPQDQDLFSLILQYKEKRQEIRDARDEGEDISSDSSDSSFDRQLDDIDKLLDQAVIPGLTSMFYEDQTEVQQVRDTADHIKQRIEQLEVKDWLLLVDYLLLK